MPKSVSLPASIQKKLQRLDALEALIKSAILPSIRGNLQMAEAYSSTPYEWELSDDQVRARMQGHAKWDDPPDGWSDHDLLNWSRGYLYAEHVVGGNLEQGYFHANRLLSMEPLDALHRSERGILSLAETCGCNSQTIEEADGVHLQRRCPGCGHIHTPGNILDVLASPRQDQA